jgi:cell division protein FtsW
MAGQAPTTMNAPGAGPRPRPGVDRTLAIAIGLLVLLGLIVMYTASYGLGYQAFDDPNHFVKRQMLWLAVGLAAAGFMFMVDYRTWRRYTVLMMAGTVVVLVGILAVGADRFGGQRWILGGGSIQPSELAKLMVVLYVADWLSSKREDVKDLTLGLVPFAILIGFLCGLVILQPNFSTAIILGAMATAMFFTAGADLRQMVISGAIAGVVLVLLILQAPHARQRLNTFFDPMSDPSGAGYHVLQTLDAIKRGGLLGVGLGQGQTKHILPAAHTDAIFAVLGEEVGLLGCLVVVALFMVVAWRGFRIAAGLPDRFASLVATGITCWLVIQALVNIAVVTAFMPFTGVPLPFISFGGSSLVTCLAAAGLLLNISRRVDPARTRLYVPMDLRRGHRRARLSRAHRARRVRGRGHPGLVARDAG